MYWCLDGGVGQGTGIKYGMQCIDILEGWALKNKVWKGNNAPLEAAWAICAMARAAVAAPARQMEQVWRGQDALEENRRDF